jgi:hypothetical protein
MVDAQGIQDTRCGGGIVVLVGEFFHVVMMGGHGRSAPQGGNYRHARQVKADIGPFGKIGQQDGRFILPFFDLSDEEDHFPQIGRENEEVAGITVIFKKIPVPFQVPIQYSIRKGIMSLQDLQAVIVHDQVTQFIGLAGYHADKVPVSQRGCLIPGIDQPAKEAALHHPVKKTHYHIV